MSAFPSYSCRVILYPLHSCRPVEAAPWVGSREALTSSSSSLVRASPLCPPSSPGIGTTCGGFLLGRMGIPAGLLSLSPPRALAGVRPVAPTPPSARQPARRTYRPERCAQRRGTPPSVSAGCVTLPPARSHAHATADGPGVEGSPPGHRPRQHDSGQVCERPAPVRP